MKEIPVKMFIEYFVLLKSDIVKINIVSWEEKAIAISLQTHIHIFT